MTMTTEFEPCTVCGELLTATREAFCTFCGQPYHLNLRSDMTDPECGQVWLSDENMGLEFGCKTCLEQTVPEEADLDEVLDLDEAAAVARLSPDALRVAADAGRVAHRKTASGIYLFRRGDVLPATASS